MKIIMESSVRVPWAEGDIAKRGHVYDAPEDAAFILINEQRARQVHADAPTGSPEEQGAAHTQETPAAEQPARLTGEESEKSTDPQP